VTRVDLWKWLYPGMGVKRWLLVMAAGVLLVSAGFTLIVDVDLLGAVERGLARGVGRLAGSLTPLAVPAAALAVIASGAACIVVGLRQTIRSLLDVVLPGHIDSLANLVYRRHYLKRGPRVVAIGGGTGLSTLLRGVKGFTSNITAIVTVADDGGSSGRLRVELGMPPPGDVRNTLVALADTESLMERLFQYRFQVGEGLKGHSFGNLFIAAMTEITGDFEQAVRESSKVLAVRGQVLPATLQPVVLAAEYADGSRTRGESQLPRAGKRIRRVALEPPDVQPLAEAVRAIREADVIVLGPGSLYTSILPNLLVPGIADAIRRSEAMRVYVCNVMTQPGETDGYAASDHVRALLDHAGPGIVDYVLLNSGRVPPGLAEKYRQQGAYPVVADLPAIRALGLVPISRPLISATDLARHDSEKLALALRDLWEAHRAAHGQTRKAWMARLWPAWARRHGG